ncbi:carbohydrate kinase family protein [Celerinatantimonas yamalensis]|uniref:Carbohydrate kinase family protein n=1 Tax=Celerinatantimonas yamalensis TaxID=559956 RepID=A0ABW9GA23_9GAMM
MIDNNNFSPLYIVGNVNIDLIMGQLDSWPQRGTEVLLDTNTWRVGGSAGNSALAAQALGIPSHLVANQSYDLWGQWLAEHFQQSHRWPKVDIPTSITVGITHSDSERTFFSAKGNVEKLSLTEVLEQLPEQVPPQTVVLLSGAFLTLSLLDDYLELLTTLKQRQFTVALDCGWPPQQWKNVRKQVQQWLPWIDLLLVNEIEIQQLTEHSQLSSAVEHLAAKMPKTARIIVKRGANGASSYIKQHWDHCQAPNVKVVDTVGAGDIFNTGYLAAFILNKSHAEALRWGITLASQAISTTPRQLMNKQQLTLAMTVGDMTDGES